MTRNSNAFRLLIYAFAAMDHGSLRQAARELRVGESCVSRNVARLEQLLETQLFERDAHGVRLTASGQAWASVARVHYEGLLGTFAECMRHDDDAKTLRIGLCAVRGGEFLNRLIARFGNMHPDVKFAIEDVPTGQCLAAVRRRRLDVAFTHEGGSAKSCRSEVLWQERLFVLLPSGHPLTIKPALVWSDLIDLPLLVPIGLEGPPMDARLLRHIEACGGPTIEICRASQATVIFKVQLGQGVTVAGESLARAVAVDAAVWRPLDGRNSLSSIRAIWLDSNSKRAVLRLMAMAGNMLRAIPDTIQSKPA